MGYDKSVYEMAESEIKRRRYQAESMLEKRQNEIEQKIPEIKEILIQLSQTNIELTKLIIKKKKDFSQSFNRIKDQNLQGQAMIHELLTKNGYPHDYLDSQYTCKVCSDRGFIDGGRCQCFTILLNKYSVQKLNQIANMPVCDFEHFSLKYYQGLTDSMGNDCYTRMSQIFEYCRKYADFFDLKSDSLLLYGNTGLGKTHISLAIAKTVAEKGYNVAYGSLLNFLRIIEKEHFGRAADSEADTMQVLINSDLLILDDLGSEFQTGFYESVTYNIINSRINLGLPTIVSTNLSVDAMQNRYNDRLMSRVFGVYTMFCFTGKDIRQIKRLSGV